MAISAIVLTANAALAGGPGKKSSDGCPAACQQQIDDLNSSQAQQNEQLGTQGKQLQNHEGRITTLEKNAYDPWYGRIGLKMGWGQQTINDATNPNISGDWNTDLGWGGALAFGRQFGQFRAELEVAYQKADLSKQQFAVNSFNGDASALTVMPTGYYQIPIVDAFSLYGMAGMGYAKVDGKVNKNGAVRFSEGMNSFAYKAGAGVTYDFAANMAGDLGYEYLGFTGELTSADGLSASGIHSHNIVASVRYKF